MHGMATSAVTTSVMTDAGHLDAAGPLTTADEATADETARVEVTDKAGRHLRDHKQRAEFTDRITADGVTATATARPSRPHPGRNTPLMTESSQRAGAGGAGEHTYQKYRGFGGAE